jgi:hypothetical protein
MPAFHRRRAAIASRGIRAQHRAGKKEAGSLRCPPHLVGEVDAAQFS